MFHSKPKTKVLHEPAVIVAGPPKRQLSMYRRWQSLNFIQLSDASEYRPKVNLLENEYQEPSALSVLSFGIKFLLMLNCHDELVGPRGNICRTDETLTVVHCIGTVGKIMLKFRCQSVSNCILRMKRQQLGWRKAIFSQHCELPRLIIFLFVDILLCSM